MIFSLQEIVDVLHLSLGFSNKSCRHGNQAARLPSHTDQSPLRLILLADQAIPATKIPAILRFFSPNNGQAYRLSKGTHMVGCQSGYILFLPS